MPRHVRHTTTSTAQETDDWRRLTTQTGKGGLRRLTTQTGKGGLRSTGCHVIRTTEMPLDGQTANREEAAIQTKS